MYGPFPHSHEGDEQLRNIAHWLRQIYQTLKQIRDILAAEHTHIFSARISVMPKSIQVGQPATAHITATKTDGSPFQITSADAVAVSASNPATVSIGTTVINADGSADVPLTGVAVDPGNTITAVVDGVSSNTDTLTVTPAVPATVTLSLL